MTMHHPKLADLVRRDPRYAYEAYEFVFAALAHTQKMLASSRGPAATAARAETTHEEGEEAGGAVGHHVSGPELLEGARDLALREFGRLARVVLHLWGIDRTDDIGEIVFNLVDAKLMSKTATDQRSDFHAVYDLDQVLLRDYQIRLDETE
jgi:uncharacterized repeat protein (TIGR04138 family)